MFERQENEEIYKHPVIKANIHTSVLLWLNIRSSETGLLHGRRCENFRLNVQNIILEEFH